MNYWKAVVSLIAPLISADGVPTGSCWISDLLCQNLQRLPNFVSFLGCQGHPGMSQNKLSSWKPPIAMLMLALSVLPGMCEWAWAKPCHDSVNSETSNIARPGVENSLFYPAFILLDAAKMAASVRRQRETKADIRGGNGGLTSTGPLPVITLRAGAAVPRRCFESIKGRCRKVALLLQCCTTSWGGGRLVTMACSTFPTQRAAAYPSLCRRGWLTQIITITVAFSPLTGRSRHAVGQHNNRRPNRFK